MDPNEAIEIVYGKNNNNNYKNNKNPTAGDRRIERWREGETIFILYFIFVSFSDLRKSDHRFSSDQKAKLVYTTKATRRYQKPSISSHFKRKEIFLFVLFRA